MSKYIYIYYENKIKALDTCMCVLDIILFSRFKINCEGYFMLYLFVHCTCSLTSTHPNKNFTLFIMGVTIPEIKTPVPPNAANEIQ